MVMNASVEDVSLDETGERNAAMLIQSLRWFHLLHPQMVWEYGYPSGECHQVENAVKRSRASRCLRQVSDIRPVVSGSNVAVFQRKIVYILHTLLS